MKVPRGARAGSTHESGYSPCQMAKMRSTAAWCRKKMGSKAEYLIQAMWPSRPVMEWIVSWRDSTESYELLDRSGIQAALLKVE